MWSKSVCDEESPSKLNVLMWITWINLCYGHVGHTSAICSSLLITCAHRLSERVGNLNFKQLVEGHDIKTSAGGVYFMTKIEINPVSPNITKSISILTASLSLLSVSISWGCTPLFWPFLCYCIWSLYRDFCLGFFKENTPGEGGWIW